MQKLSVFLSSLFLVFTACSKDNPQPEQQVSATLTFDTIQTVSGMRVFAGSLVPLDSQFHRRTIQNYLDRKYSSGSTFYLSKFSEPTASFGKWDITFDNYGEIQFGVKIIGKEKYGPVKVLKSVVTNKVSDDPLITQDFFKYNFEQLSNGTYNYQYVLHQHENELAMSLMYYKLVRYDAQGNRVSLDFGFKHNEFNEAFLESLGPRDTLAVKEYQLLYSKKD